MIKSVVFDRDGVLADFAIVEAAQYFAPLLPIDLDQLSERWEAWGNTAGFPTSLREEKLFFDGLWNSICDEFMLPSETRAELLAFDYTDYMKPFQDARPAMEYVRHRELTVGVLSNFALASLEASLEAIGLLDLADCACAATVIGASKPDPESYLTVCGRLGVKPEECLFLDDEVECVEGARAVGMAAYQVDRQLAEHRISAGIVSSLDVLPDLLARH